MSQNVVGLILAAGRSTRMGEANKLLTPFRSKPLLHHVLDAANASRLARTIVVTGHDREKIEALVGDRAVLAHNADYANGMAGSLRNGIYRMQGKYPVLVMLGDMPLIDGVLINRMLDAFEKHDQSAIVVATHDGRWGNPVLFGTDYFAALKMLDGDEGARSIIRAHRSKVVEVDTGSAAAIDLDTPEAFREHL